ncbi:MAG: apolipoprotein N-acyltransferase, partial [Rhodanobacteraceae bacterium]
MIARAITAYAGFCDRLMASTPEVRAEVWAVPMTVLLGGAVSVLAFAPFGLAPLAIVCLAGLFWLCERRSPKRAANLGLLFGVGQFGAGTTWLFVALHDVGGAPVALSVLLLTLLVLAMALYPAVVMALAARLAPRAGLARYLLVLPALWVLGEWLRSWLLTGFSWLSLGYSQIATPLAGYVPLLGVFGASAAVALSAGLLVLLLHAGPVSRRGWAVVALAVLWLGGGLLHRVDWTHPVGAPLRVSLMQGDVAQGIKWQAGASERDLRLYQNLTHGHDGSNLIAWPETAIPTFYRDLRPRLRSLDARLRADHATLLTGLLRASPDGQRVYNSVVALGATSGFYDKRHLVPFGEYFPVPGFVRRWLAGMALPHSDFSRGAARQPLLTVAGHPVGISICYEDAFNRDILPALPAAALLVNVSDDAWFGRSLGPAQHFQMARMRALETGRVLLRVDNSSVTAVVG